MKVCTSFLFNQTKKKRFLFFYQVKSISHFPIFIYTKYKWVLALYSQLYSYDPKNWTKSLKGLRKSRQQRSCSLCEPANTHSFFDEILIAQRVHYQFSKSDKEYSKFWTDQHRVTMWQQSSRLFTHMTLFNGPYPFVNEAKLYKRAWPQNKFFL